MLMERFLKESTQAVVYLDIFENNPTAQKFFSKFGARREMHVSERFMPSSSAMSTASNSITFRRYNDSTDRLLIRNGLRAIFEAEGVDIARLYIPFEQQDIDDFDKGAGNDFYVLSFRSMCFCLDYGGTTLCAIDDNQPVGFLTFMRTNQCPFGVDYGQYNDGEDYLVRKRNLSLFVPLHSLLLSSFCHIYMSQNLTLGGVSAPRWRTKSCVATPICAGCDRRTLQSTKRRRNGMRQTASKRSSRFGASTM